jgi:hypothetical protein
VARVARIPPQSGGGPGCGVTRLATIVGHGEARAHAVDDGGAAEYLEPWEILPSGGLASLDAGPPFFAPDEHATQRRIPTASSSPLSPRTPTAGLTACARGESRSRKRRPTTQRARSLTGSGEIRTDTSSRSSASTIRCGGGPRPSRFNRPSLTLTWTAIKLSSSVSAIRRR